jgi:hypothetical protein
MRTFHPSQRSQALDLAFNEPNRVVFFTKESSIHDNFITAEYTFTSPTKLHSFYGDLLRKTHISSFDIQVIWSNKHSEKNAMGAFSGMATLEKLDLWKDRKYPYRHLISFLASKSSGELEEYRVRSFNCPLKRKNETVWLDKKGPDKYKESVRSSTSGGRRASMLKRFTKRGSVSEGKYLL